MGKLPNKAFAQECSGTASTSYTWYTCEVDDFSGLETCRSQGSQTSTSPCSIIGGVCRAVLRQFASRCEVVSGNCRTYTNEVAGFCPTTPPPPPPPSCGDGYCNASIGENCATCAGDCGSCPIDDGNSGGSGGGNCVSDYCAGADQCYSQGGTTGGAGPRPSGGNCSTGTVMCCVPSGGGGPTMPNCAAPSGLTGRCEVYDTYMRLLWEWTSPWPDLYNEVQFTNDPTFASTIYQGVRNLGVTSFPSQYHDYRGLPPLYPDPTGRFPVDNWYLRVRTSSGDWCVPTTWGNPVALRPENCTDFRTPNNTPTVTITAPPNGSTYLQGDNVTISATATDSDGTITSVSLYRDSTLFWGMSNPSSTSTYATSFPWYNIPAGSYSITARATDDRGAVGVSAPVNFTVNAFQNITGNVYVDPNATVNLSTGICTGSTGALSGAEGSLGVQVVNTSGGTTYNSALSGSGWSVTTPPASDGRFRAALLGLDPNYVCACPVGCSYTAGISSPQANVNFYLTPTADAWFQVEGGPIAAFSGAGKRALSNLIPEFCSPPTCNPYLIVNQNGGDSEGYVLTGGGYVSGTDNIDESGHNWVARMTSAPERRQDYRYFKILSLLPTSPKSDFSPFEPIEGAVTSLDKPDKGKEFVNGEQARAYFHQGEAVIDSPWSVEADEKIVVLIDGDITIEETITVETGGFFMLVVSGDITFDASLGTDDLNNLDAVAEGVFVADGILRVESVDTGGDKRFIGEGTFVGWSGVDLQRDYDDGGGRRALNNVSAIEYFRYRPDFITAAPEEFMRSRYSWQQVNP